MLAQVRVKAVPAKPDAHQLFFMPPGGRLQLCVTYVGKFSQDARVESAVIVSQTLKWPGQDGVKGRLIQPAGSLPGFSGHLGWPPIAAPVPVQCIENDDIERQIRVDGMGQNLPHRPFAFGGSPVNLPAF